jgi:hypothetical protein
MFLSHLLQSNAAKAAAATTSIAAARDAAGPVVIEVSAWIYTSFAVLLSLAGVYLARLVTIDAENKRLGRVQTMRETGPLTWIGVLIVGPLIWHFEVAIPWAPIIGLGVGYSVRAMLKVFGGGALASARYMLRGAAAALEEKESLAAVPVPDDDPHIEAMKPLLAKLDDVPAVPVPPKRKTE